MMVSPQVPAPWWSTAALPCCRNSTWKRPPAANPQMQRHPAQRRLWVNRPVTSEPKVKPLAPFDFAYCLNRAILDARVVVGLARSPVSARSQAARVSGSSSPYCCSRCRNLRQNKPLRDANVPNDTSAPPQNPLTSHYRLQIGQPMVPAKRRLHSIEIFVESTHAAFWGLQPSRRRMLTGNTAAGRLEARRGAHACRRLPGRGPPLVGKAPPGT